MYYHLSRISLLILTAILLLCSCSKKKIKIPDDNPFLGEWRSIDGYSKYALKKEGNLYIDGIFDNSIIKIVKFRIEDNCDFNGCRLTMSINGGNFSFKSNDSYKYDTISLDGRSYVRI